MSYVDKLLARDENVVLQAYRHPLFMILRVAPLVLGAIVLWILGVLAYAFVPTVGGILGIILAVSSFVPLAMALYRFMWWRREQYIITNYRIIQVEGIVNRRTFDSALEKVNDVETTQSMFGRMFDFGSINIITGSEIGVNELHGISKPYEFKRALLEAKLAFGHGEQYMDPSRTEFAKRAMPSEAQATGPDDHTRRIPTVEEDADPARITIALTELRNAGVISDDEYRERLAKITER